MPSGRTIGYSASGEWTFPAGTVFVKHFELGPDQDSTSPRRLETRLLAVDERGGVFGASDRWRPDGSDADLVREAGTDEGAAARGPTSRRRYCPSPAGCRVCHTAAAGGILGVKARQLHRAFPDPNGMNANQLRTWDRLGLLAPRLAEAELSSIPRPVAAEDATRLDERESRLHSPAGRGWHRWSPG